MACIIPETGREETLKESLRLRLNIENSYMPGESKEELTKLTIDYLFGSSRKAGLYAKSLKALQDVNKIVSKF